MKGLCFGDQGDIASASGIFCLRLFAVVVFSFSLSSSAQDDKPLNADGDFMVLWNRLETAQTARHNQAEDRQVRKSKLFVEIAQLRDRLDELPLPVRSENAKQYHARVVRMKAKKHAVIHRKQTELERFNAEDISTIGSPLSGDLLVNVVVENHGVEPDRTATMLLNTSSEVISLAVNHHVEEQSYQYVAFDNVYRMTTPIIQNSLKEKCADDTQIYSLFRGKFHPTLTMDRREDTYPDDPANAKNRETCLDETRNICLNHPHVKSLIAEGRKDYALGWCLENEEIRKQRNDADDLCNFAYHPPFTLQVTSRKIEFKWNEPVQVMKIMCLASGNPVTLWDRTFASGSPALGITRFETDVVLKEYEVGIPPKLRTRVDPIYPEEARQQGHEGKVFLELLLDKFGGVIDVRVLHSDNSLFERSARTAVLQWKYTPAIYNGRPVRTYKNVTVIFTLH